MRLDLVILVEAHYLGFMDEALNKLNASWAEIVSAPNAGMLLQRYESYDHQFRFCINPVAALRMVHLPYRYRILGKLISPVDLWLSHPEHRKAPGFTKRALCALSDAGKVSWEDVAASM